MYNIHNIARMLYTYIIYNIFLYRSQYSFYSSCYRYSQWASVITVANCNGLMRDSSTLSFIEHSSCNGIVHMRELT